MNPIGVIFLQGWLHTVDINIGYLIEVVIPSLIYSKSSSADIKVRRRLRRYRF